jgi:leader peptidase (prepilin peptidase)/N-methyltransferase
MMSFSALQQMPSLWVGFMTLIGLGVGSFLNVVVYRLPIIVQRQWQQDCETVLNASQKTKHPKWNLWMPRSHCPQCHQPIAIRDNIPLISYWLLRGRCRGCSKTISIRYPFVELFTGLITLLISVRLGPSWSALWYCMAFWLLIATALIDYDEQLLLDELTYPLLWLGLLGSTLGIGPNPWQAIWGVMLGYGCLWSLYWIFKFITGKEGMGYGDFKLLGALGAWVGWTLIPTTLFIASFTAVLISFWRMFQKRHKRGDKIAFGPFLALGGAVVIGVQFL